jgi:hypothetical protein
VHVDVDAARVDRKPQRVRGLAVVVQHVAVGLAHGVREHAVAHEAAVDEQDLGAGSLRRMRRPDRVALELDARRARLDGRRAANERLAEQRLDALGARSGSKRWISRPLWISVKPVAGCASASRVNASSQCAHSVASVRRNLRRAGVLK